MTLGTGVASAWTYVSNPQSRNTLDNAIVNVLDSRMSGDSGSLDNRSLAFKEVHVMTSVRHISPDGELVSPGTAIDGLSHGQAVA